MRTIADIGKRVRGSRDAGPDPGVPHLWLLVAAVTCAIALRVAARAGGGDGVGHVGDMIAVFGAGVPSLSAVAMSMLPGEGVPFPRLFRAAWWLQAVGLALLVVGASWPMGGDLHPRWLFQSAWDADTTGPETWLMAVGAVLTLVAGMATALNGVTKVLADGADARSAMSWGVLGHGVATLMGAPVLVMALLLALAERSLSLGVLGGTTGDPTMFLHLYWFGVHALLGAAVVPVVGLALDSLGVGTTRRGRRAWGAGPLLLAFALVVPAGYGQHLTAAGIAPVLAFPAAVSTALALTLLLRTLLSSLGARFAGAFGALEAAALGVMALTLSLAAIGVASGALLPAIGMDVVWFGRPGRDSLVGVVAFGLLLAWLVRRASGAGRRVAGQPPRWQPSGQLGTS